MIVLNKELRMQFFKNKYLQSSFNVALMCYLLCPNCEAFCLTLCIISAYSIGEDSGGKR